MDIQLFTLVCPDSSEVGEACTSLVRNCRLGASESSKAYHVIRMQVNSLHLRPDRLALYAVVLALGARKLLCKLLPSIQFQFLHTTRAQIRSTVNQDIAAPPLRAPSYHRRRSIRTRPALNHRYTYEFASRRSQAPGL